MQTVTKNLNELKRPEKNVRLHGDRQIKEYIRSIEMFGQIRPLVIDEDNVVLAGNGLLTALQQMGRETADCYVMTGLSAKDKKKLMLADNKIFELGINDTTTFDEMLRELGGDIDIPGYDAELLKVLTASAKEANEMISSYGTFSEESMKKITSPRTQMQVPTETQKFSVEQVNGHYNNFEDIANKKKTIICPHCGKEIEIC